MGMFYRSLIRRCRRVAARFTVFSSLRDALAYWFLAKFWLPWPRIVRLHVRGLAVPMRCRPRTSDAHSLFVTMHDRFHLPPIPLRKDCVILDLGANAGYTAAHLACLYPQARIIGMEMDETNAQLARVNVAAFQPQCHIIHAAAWTGDGWITYGGQREEAYKICEIQESPPSHVRRAPARGINSILEEFDLDRIDYVKMDIEGAESAVLTYATEWLDRVLSLKVEIHPPASIEQIIGALARKGFAAWRDDRHPACVAASRAIPDANSAVLGALQVGR
jgi:FkbM family methyltransferase